jgi:hypothetical protein
MGMSVTYWIDCAFAEATPKAKMAVERSVCPILVLERKKSTK